MGADYPKQEIAIEQIKKLPKEAKELLSHHLRNPLTGILGGVETGELNLIKNLIKHMVKDLEKFGL